MSKFSGQLTKMAVTLPADNQAQYAMRLGDEQMPMNDLLGQSLTLRYQGEIHCLNCQRLTKKSFSGGFCPVSLPLFQGWPLEPRFRLVISIPPFVGWNRIITIASP